MLIINIAKEIPKYRFTELSFIKVRITNITKETPNDKVNELSLIKDANNN